MFTGGKCGVFSDLKGVIPFRKGLVTTLASGNISDVPDQRYATLRTGEGRRLTINFLGSPRLNYRRRTRRDERILRTNSQHGLVSLEDELTIALVGEEKVALEEAFAVDSGVSVRELLPLSIT